MSRKRIMIIESDEVLARRIASVCDELGFDVWVFNDALDALIRATKTKPDLILFDAKAAEVGSMELTDVITRDRRFLSIPLITIVDESDRSSLLKYAARGLAIARRPADDGEGLWKELRRLLEPYADYTSSTRENVAAAR